MTKFKVKSWTNHIVHVEIVDTVKEFEERYRKVYGLKGKVEACCFHTFDKEGDKNVGTICFYAKNINVELITHELTHVMTGIMASEGWAFMNNKHNEKIAFTLGYLVGDTCAAITKHGFTVELSSRD
jgi:hypothetical protein